MTEQIIVRERRVIEPPREVDHCISEESLMALFSCSFVTQWGLAGKEIKGLFDLALSGEAMDLFLLSRVQILSSFNIRGNFRFRK